MVINSVQVGWLKRATCMLFTTKKAWTKHNCWPYRYYWKHFQSVHWPSLHLQVQHVDQMEYCGAGTLPAEWGQNGSFQALSTFSFSSQKVNGTLPAEWGNPAAFQLLEDFELLNSSVTGIVSINVKARIAPANIAAKV